MATLYKNPKGRWQIDVYGYGRVRLGKRKPEASAIYSMIQSIEESNRLGQPLPPIVGQWLDVIEEPLRKRLVKIGLVKPSGETVGDLVDYMAKRDYAKSNSARNRRNAERSFEAFFKRGHALRDIKKPDGQQFLAWMRSKGKKFGEGKGGLAEATAARRFKHARSMLSIAVEFGWIRSNPFKGIKPGKQSNPSRAFFVTPEMAEKISSELPTAQLRLAFALGRWGGLRIPSELMGFTWSCVNWDRSSLTFDCPKTEGYGGLEIRTCPIFPKLRPFLADAWDAAEEGATHCLPEIVNANNPHRYITKRVKAAMKRAGVEYQKPFNNLRATRATEIDDQFGSKAESDWIGHGADVALKHYLMNTDEKWARAIGADTERKAAKCKTKV